MKASWCKYRLDFKFTAITSRERMNSKDTYYIRITDSADKHVFGLGEAGLFRGLSCDDRPDFETVLAEVCREIDRYAADPAQLADFPSIRFAVETATRDLANGGRRIIFPSQWTQRKSSLTINGLVWMGNADEMRRRIDEKLAQGFTCVKLKIGGIDFEEELRLLAAIRERSADVELRLDANGAFSPADALQRLERLARFRIHSIEQPIRAGQWDAMSEICRQSPIPIALDEELIGLNSEEEKRRMLSAIRPQYIILKPTLCGGIGGSEEWIRLAEEAGISWWATSALESNVGLNAIAQWTASLNPSLPQGLGTGQLYHNNIPSPLTLRGDRLSYGCQDDWKIPDLQWNCD